MTVAPIRPFEAGTTFRDRANNQEVKTLNPNNNARGYTAYLYTNNPTVQASLPDEDFDKKFVYAPIDRASRPPERNVAGVHDQRVGLSALTATGTPQDSAPSLEEEREAVEAANRARFADVPLEQSRRGATPNEMEAGARVRTPVRSPTVPGIAIVPPHGANASGDNPIDRRAPTKSGGERIVEGAESALAFARGDIGAAALHVTQAFSTVGELARALQRAEQDMSCFTHGEAFDIASVPIDDGRLAFTLTRAADGAYSMRFLRT